MKYFYIFFFFILKYIYESRYINCNNSLGELLLIFHNLISTYIFFGQFLFPVKYHILLIFILWGHWLTNNNKCIISQINHNLCPY